MTPLTTLGASRDTAHRLAETRIRQPREIRFFLPITGWQSCTGMVLHDVRFTLAATFIDL